MRPLKVFIIAGEPSGDKLGGNLMKGLQSLTDGAIEFQGVGGEMMQAAGLQSLFPMSDLSIMGLLEVIPAIPKLKKRIKQTTDAAIMMDADVFITIDSPDFCLRVGKKLRLAKPNQYSIHYVAPSVWAWRPERAAKMAKTVDHVLALLPFEPMYMEHEGMTCDFVGHPAVNEERPTKEEVKQVLTDLNLSPSDDIISILPGSRKSEINRLLPIYKEAIIDILKQHPDVKFILPAARPVLNLIQEQLENTDLPITILDPSEFDPVIAEQRKRAVYTASQLAIATSGTIALDLAKQRCPMVIAYRASWMTERAVKRLAQTDRANLINIITDSYVVPELLFNKCTPDAVAKSVLDILNDESTRNAQVAACDHAMKQLGEGHENPGLRSALSVMNAIQANQSDA
ncbi:lipid-A-disaccharide synthase [Amylibacter sp. SFDW26]|nr:lipid-A-disaccharide synthase [Amylibacter sp. SFDW26]